MSTVAILALVIAVWGQRLLGGFVVGPMLGRRPATARIVGLLPAAVVMAVVVQLSVADGRQRVTEAKQFFSGAL